MDRTFYAAQQGVMVSLLGSDQEANLEQFLNGLRHEPDWTDEQVAEVESKIRAMLGASRHDDWLTEKTYRLRPELRK